MIGKYFLNKKYGKFFGILFIILLASYCYAYLVFYKNSVSAQIMPSADAIAIRVIPNPERYSPIRWYREQGFTGSPQSLMVDGYEAVRDGRSVYVNAANIVSGTLYTNIYLISYNQDAENETSNIFGNILKNWKFNTNVSGVGSCSNSTTQTDCSNTIGCWLFDEDFKDSSGNNNNGSDGGSGVVFTDGVGKKAASFDGINDGVQISNPMGLSDSSFTISHWIKTTQGSSQMYTVGNAGDGRGYRFGLTSGKISFLIGNGVAIYKEGICGIKAVNDGKWHQITGVYDRGNAFSCYVDGVFENSTPIPLYAGMNDIAPGIGSPPCCSKFKGQLDQVKIFKSALSPEKIMEEYNVSKVKQCITDSECLGEDYCDSPKASITRDTIRLSRLVEMNIAINDYKEKKGYYPKLESGTYLPNSTLSTWPSWQENLGKELGITLPLDPINKLGSCPGAEYDKKTCWNKDTKKFADSDLVDPLINPPSNSNVFIYSASSNGSSYNICAIMGSGYITGAGAGACSGSAAIVYGGTTTNNAPRFTGSNLSGYFDEAFNGYLSAVDPDGDPLEWSINTSATTWTLWSDPPSLATTPVANQKKIYADKAGKAGNYVFSASISDGKITTTQNFTIRITEVSSSALIISANDITYTASSSIPLDYMLTAQSSAARYPLTYALTPAISTIAGITGNFAQNGSIYEYKAFGIPSSANIFNNVSTINPYNFSIKVTDAFGKEDTANFKISIINHPPVISIPVSCSDETRINTPYSCQSNFSDPDGHIASAYQINGEPLGLTINSWGAILGAPSVSNNFIISVSGKDEFGYSSATKTYPLKVFSNSCKDGSFDFQGGFHNATVYDTNPTTTSIPASSVAGGAYLKLSNLTPRITPYIWIADTALNKVSKIRTFSGQKMECAGSYPNRHCYLVSATWEDRGQLIGAFPVGTSPSAVAVNAETGDVWIANSGSNNIYKLKNNGSLVKSCNLGNSPRALAIEANGDVWVSYATAKLEKISGDDNPANCVLATIINTAPAQDITIDIDNNVWTTNRNAGGAVMVGGMQKINTITKTLVNFGGINYIPATNAYSIATDILGNVWATKGYCEAGVYKVLFGGSVSAWTDTGQDPAGIVTDFAGNIWTGEIVPGLNGVIRKVNQGVGSIFTLNSGGKDPTELAIDSASQIWSINVGSNNVRVFNLSGNILSLFGADIKAVPGSVYCIYDVNGDSNCSNDGNSSVSSSGDATGMERSMLLRSGEWTSGTSGFFDSGYQNEFWGNISWQEQIDFPVKQSIEVKIRVSNDPNFTGAEYMSSANWNALSMYNNSRRGRYLGVIVIIKSNIIGNSPVIWNMKVNCDIGFVNPIL